MSRSCFLPFLALLVLQGCAAASHPVTIVVAGDSVAVTRRPAYVGSGDSVRVRLFDRAYVNRYVAHDSQTTLVALDGSTMAGDTSLKAMSLSFEPSRIWNVPPQPAPVVPAGAVAEAPLLLRPTGPVGARYGLKFNPGRSRAERQYDSVRVLIAAADARMDTITTEAAARLDTLRARVRGDRAEQARLALMHDTRWFGRADALTKDAGALRAEALLLSAANGASDSVLSPLELREARGQMEQYGRRLDLFRATLPADPPASLSDTSRVPQLLAAVARGSAEFQLLRARRARLEADAHGIAATLAAAAPIPDASEFPQAIVQGRDLSALLESPTALEDVAAESRDRLDQVNATTVRVVAAANQLPRWTMRSDTAQVFTSLYPAEKEVRVVVTRRSRYAAWGTGAATVTTVTTVTAGGKPAEAGAPAAASSGSEGMPLVAVPRGDDTVAVLTIPVLQRYRFRLGVGMLVSSLRSAAVETREDSAGGVPGVFVSTTGRDEHRFVPVALLSTTIYPLEGRFVDGRARRYPLQNASVSLQTGISLQNPTEHLYAGLALEPLQGLEIGGGLHFGYVENTPYASGTFVPLAQGAATGSEWKTAWAGTVTLDATTFVRAFGSLLGL